MARQSQLDWAANALRDLCGVVIRRVRRFPDLHPSGINKQRQHMDLTRKALIATSGCVEAELARMAMYLTAVERATLLNAAKLSCTA